MRFKKFDSHLLFSFNGLIASLFKFEGEAVKTGNEQFVSY